MPLLKSSKEKVYLKNDAFNTLKLKNELFLHKIYNIFLLEFLTCALRALVRITLMIILDTKSLL